MVEKQFITWLNAFISIYFKTYFEYAAEFNSLRNQSQVFELSEGQLGRP